MFEVSESYISFGQSTFYSEVAIPAGRYIEEIAKDYPVTDDINLNITCRPTAFLTGLEAFIGVSVIFFGKWAAEKFFDEVYDVTIGPPIKEYLNAYIEKQNSNKKFAISILARKPNSKASALICCVGTSVEEIKASEIYIPSVLGIAEEYVSTSSENSLTYLFVIDDGQVNLEPKIYSDVESALEGLKRKYPAEPPSHITLIGNERDS